jgi:hypothetical protein
MSVGSPFEQVTNAELKASSIERHQFHGGWNYAEH